MAKLADIGSEFLHGAENVGGAVLHGVSKVPRALANVVSVNPAGNALVSTLFPSKEQKAQIEDRRFAREQKRKNAKLNNAIAEERLKVATQTQANNQKLFKQQQTQLAIANIRQITDASFQTALNNLAIQLGQAFSPEQIKAIQDSPEYVEANDAAMAMRAIGNYRNGHEESLDIAKQLMSENGIVLKDGGSLEDAVKNGEGTFVFPALDPDGPEGQKPAPEFTLHNGNFDQVYNFLIQQTTEPVRAIIKRGDWAKTGAGEALNTLADKALEVLGNKSIVQAQQYAQNIMNQMPQYEKINFSILHELNALKKFSAGLDTEEIQNSGSMLMNLQRMSPDIEGVTPAPQGQGVWEGTKVRYKGFEEPISLEKLRQILSDKTPTYTHAMETLKQIGVAQEEQKKADMDALAAKNKLDQLHYSADTARYLAVIAKSKGEIKKQKIHELFDLALKNGDLDIYADAIMHENGIDSIGKISAEMYYRYWIGQRRKAKDRVDATNGGFGSLYSNGVGGKSKELPAGTLKGVAKFTGNEDVIGKEEKLSPTDNGVNSKK